MQKPSYGCAKFAVKMKNPCDGYVLVYGKDEMDKYIENLQASHYAESVDMGMANRQLKRSLWLSRARSAKHLVTAFENYDYLDVYKLNIKQESARTWMTCKLRTPAEWIKIWKNVQAKCEAYAEKFV
jgi:hypothetical protein